MIYKYYSCPTESPEELLIKITEKLTIRASDPTSFNDPFEFKFRINFGNDVEIAKKRYLSDHPDKSEFDFIRWWENLNRPNSWYLEQEARSNLLQHVGVTCFSSTCKNHLLWSHYASNHTGFCIGFDKLLMLSHSDIEDFGPVEYEENLPIINIFTDQPNDFTRKAAFHKSSEWKYEEEFRILFKTPGIKSIAKEAIKEVVLGCRAPHELRTHVQTKLGSSQVSYFQMAENPSSYSLEKTTIEKNVWPMTSNF